MPIRLKALALILPVGALYAQSSVYDQQILPVLKANCAACHMVANPAGGLSLGSLDALLAGGKHGPAHRAG